MNFTKSVILAAQLYGSICVPTKFDENTFIENRNYYDQKQNPR